MADKHQQREEAIRLKTLAESKFNSSSLKSAVKYATRAHNLCPSLAGLPEMLAAFRVLHSSFAAGKSSPELHSPEFYDILGVEPFSPLSSIKAQYKKLALLLHPDKNTLKEASGEAFRLVNDAFRVLSDRALRKVYDAKLRLAIQSATEAEEEERESGSVEETFWTACSRCQLLHKFKRKYVGHCLVCPNCNQSFQAVEVTNDEDGDHGGGNEEDSGGGGGSVRRSARVRVRKAGFVEESGRNGGNAVAGRAQSKRVEVTIGEGLKRKVDSVNEVVGKGKSKRVEMSIGEGRTNGVCETSKYDDRKREKSRLGEALEKERSKIDDRKKRAKVDDRELTLAEMRMEALRKKKGKKKEGEKKVKMSEESELVKEMGRRRLGENGDMEVMTVEDSEFYDFDEDRVERSFKRGQVWAIYDDDDGMPRHYGLIDEVVSVNPFEVKMSWLDLQSSTDERLICLEKMGFHISCGRFKVGRKDSIKLLNIFSHMVDCEREARELYRIYPRKGSIWALYNEREFNTGGGSSLSRNGRCYDIAVFLTSYSEMHGLSMAYLEKVNGYRAVFKRKEIGYHAIRWLEKDDIRLFSHQIPARKLSSNDAPDISGDCWELDPASLPPDLLSITGGN